MRGLRESLLALMVCLTAAPVCAQTATVVTLDDFQSIAARGRC
jgi:hypothetical protein